MNKATAKALIIATAKAHGVKSQASEVIPALGKLRAQALQLSAKGADNKAPASTVYTKQEVYALVKGLRGVLDQIQNIPETEWRNVRDVVNRIQYAAQEAANAVYGLNKGDTARSVSRWIKNAAGSIESSIKDVRRIAGRV